MQIIPSSSSRYKFGESRHTQALDKEFFVLRKKLLVVELRVPGRNWTEKVCSALKYQQNQGSTGCSKIHIPSSNLVNNTGRDMNIATDGSNPSHKSHMRHIT